MSSSEGKPSGTSQKVTPEKRDKKSKEAMSSSKDIKKRLKEVSPKALVKKLSFITDSKKSKEKKKAKLKTEVEFSGADSDTTVSQETLCSIDSVTIVETKQDGDGGGDNQTPQSPDAPPPIKTVADGEGQKPPSAAGSSQPAAAKAPAAATGTTAPPSTPKLVDSARLEDIPSMEFLSLSASEANAGAKRECLYKILVIGELGTGKTSIIKRYVHQFFSQHYRATIGVDFALKVLNWDQNTIIRLQLWDIAGQERFGNMTRVYYKEAVGAFIVFDVTRAATFDAVVKWKQDLDAKVQLPDGSPIPCVLLANKCDQQKEGLVNTPNKMNEYCNEHRFTGWFETSAKENINIEEAAKLLVSQILNNDVTSENGQTNDPNRIALDGTDDAHHKSCNC